MPHTAHIVQPLFTAEQIAERVDALARAGDLRVEGVLHVRS
jgi:hypothetical protein